MIWLAKHGKDLNPAVYEFLENLDKETAFAKLETMSISIDKWTKEHAGIPDEGHSANKEGWGHSVPCDPPQAVDGPDR